MLKIWSGSTFVLYLKLWVVNTNIICGWHAWLVLSRENCNTRTDDLKNWDKLEFNLIKIETNRNFYNQSSPNGSNKEREKNLNVLGNHWIIITQ